MAAKEETVCSFQEIAGSHCDFQTKDRCKSVEVIPLLQCKRSIRAHTSALAFTGVENEVDLILSRASMFAPPRNFDKLNICPRHRESLGLGWRRPSFKCSVPKVISKHSTKPKERPKAERGISKWCHSIFCKKPAYVCLWAQVRMQDWLRVEIESQNLRARMGGTTRGFQPGNRRAHLFSRLFIIVPFQSTVLWLLVNLQVCVVSVELV